MRSYSRQPTHAIAAEKDIKENTAIDVPKDPIKDIRQTPLDLLKEFEWTDTDIDDPAIVKARTHRCARGSLMHAGSV